MNDVILNKKISIERCVKQIRHYYAKDNGLSFEQDYLKQDAIAMNLQRICELSLDIANYIIKIKKLGLPQTSRDAFELLYKASIISIEQNQALQAMIGFRNILVHEYQKLDLSLMKKVIEEHLSEPLEFSTHMLAYI